jgi:CO/xanthine dehydrogenase FAD-binding subunit
MYHRPESLADALALKSRLGRGATLLAGGTDVVVGARKGKIRIQEIVDLGLVKSLAEVGRVGDHLRIGAMCTHARLERSGITALAEACATVGGPQIRNLGTIGGQIGTASPAGDVSVALIALGAEVELASVRGERRLPLADLFVGPGRTAMEPDEMVVAVTVSTARRSAFLKLGKRDAVAISIVMAAASIGPDGDVAIGLGCVAPVPFRPRRAEAHLKEHGLIEASIGAAAQLVASEVSPISDHRGGAEYRRAMAGTLTGRLLNNLAQPRDARGLADDRNRPTP